MTVEMAHTYNKYYNNYAEWNKGKNVVFQYLEAGYGGSYL